MTPLRKRMTEEMARRNISPKTARNYLLLVSLFARFHKRSPAELGEEHIREWQLYMIEREYSWSYYNQGVCALRFLYKKVLRREEVVSAVPYAKKRRKLPTVLSQRELLRFFESIDNPKHRTIVMTTYAAGLRVSEVCHLRIEDIDSERMLIHIREGKGQKDRLVPLSEWLLDTLRTYFKACRPKDWLFPGRYPGRPISSRAVQRVVGRAKQVLGKRVTPHALRHSFATHLLENRIDIRTVQALMGHQRLSTTAIYNNVTRKHVTATLSPLDLMKDD